MICLGSGTNILGKGDLIYGFQAEIYMLVVVLGGDVVAHGLKNGLAFGYGCFSTESWFLMRILLFFAAESVPKCRSRPDLEV